LRSGPVARDETRIGGQGGHDLVEGAVVGGARREQSVDVSGEEGSSNSR
jgi:hypothetical protein